MKVCELYKSILGESSHQGLAYIILRFTGCNLRCRYCDTRYAFDQGSEITLETLKEKIQALSLKRILLTGGEPMLQPGLTSLMAWLLEQGYTVALETNGSLPVASVPRGVNKIMDIKCPDSGAFPSFHAANTACLAPGDEIKCVLTSRRDYEFAAKETAKLRRSFAGEIIFTAATDYIQPRQVAEWLIHDNLPVRFQVQLHKVLWGNARKR